MNEKNYCIYHLHSYLSNGVTNIDSVTDPDLYVAKAKDCGMKAMGFSEHGSLFFWLHKKESIEKAGMKYIHAVEVYITEGIQEKVRDNYHCVLIAKNYTGVKEINALVSRSFNRNDGHFYYMPRITIDELCSTSDNIIVTTACLGGVLHNGNPIIREKMINFLKNNKHRCYLEIQHHNCADQKEYNKYLLTLSKEIDVPLVAGTDTHAINNDHLKARSMLQKAKKISFSDEDEWDLTFKTYDELIEAYRKQNTLPMDIVINAVENTNVIANAVEEFPVDHAAKYPKLYDNSDAVFKQKINDGAIRRGIINYPNYHEYVKRIHDEYDTYKHNNAIDFMLLEEDYKSEMRKRGIKYGYSRGSASGSIIAYLLGITEIDSVKFNLNFERFMNRERVSLADVDTDWLSEDRKVVKDYLYTKKGLYCCDIVTFNTIATKGAINDICRSFFLDNMDHLPDGLKKEINARYSDGKSNDDFHLPSDIVKQIEKYSVHREVPYDYNKFSTQLNDEFEADEVKTRQKYPDIFWYVDLVNGCVVSVGNHPAGCVVSQFPVDEWFGTFTTSTDEYPISLLNMKEIDSLNFVKLDILGLDNIGLIYKTCELAGIDFLTPDNTPSNDIDVWNSIKDDTTMIFQWESSSATAYLKQLFSDETIARIRDKNPDFSYIDLLSIGNGAIRPAGASYRDELASGIYQDNGSTIMNGFFKNTLGYCVYQEQIIEFLHKFCGFTMGEADIVRRHFSKKTGTEGDIPIIKDGGYMLGKDGKPVNNHYIKGFTQTMQDEYGIDASESNKTLDTFLKVVIDASDYLFSKNHSDPYSWIGYICGYLRYHYPLEFITTALNIFEGKEEKSLAIIAYAKKVGIRISPIRFRHSIAKYSFDRESNQIFKGLSSIKYMNEKVSNELYELRNGKYETFVDLLMALSHTSVNSKQLTILIELDYFSEFGDANYLKAVNDMVRMLDGRKQLRKQEVETIGIPSSLMSRFCGKETDKMYSEINMAGFMKEASKYLSTEKRSLKDKISAQIKHLGYLDIIGDEYSKLAVVISIDTKYSPRLKLYSLKNGTTVDCKIEKKVYSKDKIVVGDIIKVVGRSERSKRKMNSDGEWEAVVNQYELWITKYNKVTDI